MQWWPNGTLWYTQPAAETRWKSDESNGGNDFNKSIGLEYSAAAANNIDCIGHGVYTIYPNTPEMLQESIPLHMIKSSFYIQSN